MELAQRGRRAGAAQRFAFLTYKPLGVSTSYPRTVALLLNPIAPEFVAENAYFQRVAPIVDWQLMLVIGIVIGGIYRRHGWWPVSMPLMPRGGRRFKAVRASATAGEGGGAQSARRTAAG